MAQNGEAPPPWLGTADGGALDGWAFFLVKGLLYREMILARRETAAWRSHG